MAKDVNNSTVNTFSLDKYLGSWYEIARFDHSFERGISHATADYMLMEDGTVKVTNKGIRDNKEKTSVGRAKRTRTPGLLRVSFFGPFYSDYRVLMVSDDYQYALVGSGNDKYLWILSRTPDVPQKILNGILDEAVRRGYETKKLIWVEHSARF